MTHYEYTLFEEMSDGEYNTYNDALAAANEDYTDFCVDQDMPGENSEKITIHEIGEDGREVSVKEDWVECEFYWASYEDLYGCPKQI